MTVLEGVLLAHAAATWAMVGLIVFVQVVHYPLMDRVGPERFRAYEEAHVLRTGWVVVPLMVTELATAGALPFLLPDDLRPVALGGLLLLGGIWLSTALLQAPAHGRLRRGFDAGLHRRLVTTNLVRTFLWGARGGVALLLLVRGL